MTRLHFLTKINAPVQTVFDLSRNVEIHLKSTEQTNETVVAGKTSGHLESGETVTWQGRHFGFRFTHSSVISEMRTPVYFKDEMVEGKFKFFAHEHYFEESDSATVMTDLIVYATPFGIIGTIFDVLFLKHYLKRLIRTRNETIRQIAENQKTPSSRNPS